MRRSWIAAAAGTALLCLTPFTAAATAAATAAPAPVPATQRIVVRPVNSSGHAVSGYHVKKIKGTVDCGYPIASVAAVDDDIIRCAPDAAYALACWPAAAGHHVLCLDNARKDTLDRFRASGKIPHTTARHRRAPLDLTLPDGTFCSLRSGGAGVSLRQHPNWSAFYYCTHHLAVWAPLNAKSFGVHHDGALRTVRIAADSGKKHVHKMRVSKIYLVGTA